MISSEATLAMTRFGTGYRRDLADAVRRDPKGWLKAQLDPERPVFTRTVLPELSERWAIRYPTPEERAREKVDWYRVFTGYVRGIREGRVMTALDTPDPFRERLVRFFFEHFTISMAQATLRGVTDIYVAEAIRPYVTGRFRDLLGAVMHHPMMHVYLSNHMSFGPHSPAAARSDVGLNENLGRELLELHTLGVSGGYTQSDVREAAKILTGWVVQIYNRNAPFDMRFVSDRHEPGDKSIMEHRIAEGGEKELDDLLDFLASHPSTARFISYKVAKYFIDDRPPEELVQNMAEVFLAEDGCLAAVLSVMIDHPASWKPGGRKVLLPEDWAVAFGSLCGMKGRDAATEITSAVLTLGHRVHAARSPKGWPDDRDVWFTPGYMLLRAGLAGRMYQHFGVRSDVDEALSVYFHGANQDVIRTLKGAPTPKDAFSLIAASPDFSLR